MARCADLDRAKGLAIILVVFGHIVARQDPEGVGWYAPLRAAIYLFHMPFFFYLSGFVAVLSGADRPASPAARRRRAARLLLPFLGFGLLILAGKLALGGHVMVDNLPPDFVTGLGALFWDTGHSPATSVWYLLALFAYTAALPLLARRLAGTIALAALLFAMPVPPIAYLDRLFGYLVFFLAGVGAARAGPRYLATIDRWRTAALALFASLLVLAVTMPAAGVPQRSWLLGLGLLSMPALHGLARAWPSASLAWLGERVFPIYLLNTICIGLAKAALLPLLGWRADTFPLFAAILMLAGLAGPLGLYWLSARATPAVQRQFLR